MQNPINRDYNMIVNRAYNNAHTELMLRNFLGAYGSFRRQHKQQRDNKIRVNLELITPTPPTTQSTQTTKPTQSTQTTKPNQSTQTTKPINKTNPYNQSQYCQSLPRSSTTTGLLTSLSDNVNTGIKNAFLILHLRQNNKIISVKSTTKKKQWMMPGGKIDGNETPLDAALREFNEETGFIIDRRKLEVPFKYLTRTHSRGDKTTIYYIRTTQTETEFGTYDKSKIRNQETDALEYISVDEIIRHMVNNTSHFDIINLHTFCLLFYHNILTL